MGNGHSREANLERLANVIPPYRSAKWNDMNASPKAFESEEDRKQFIESIFSVLNNNDPFKICDCQYSLVYSRNQRDRLVANILAVKPSGVIAAKVVSDEDGKDQAEAFRALLRHVELQMGVLLQTVPDVGGAAKKPKIDVPSPEPATVQPPSVTQPPVSQAQAGPADAPPSYDASGRGYGHNDRKG